MQVHTGKSGGVREKKQGLQVANASLTQNVDWGFLFSTTYRKILMSSGSKKRNPNMLPFSLKEFQQADPLQDPQRGPYGEKYPPTYRAFLPIT